MSGRTNACASNEAQDRAASAIVESLSNAVICVTPAGKITLWNQSATTLLGFRANDTLGAPFWPLVPELLQPEMREAFQSLVGGLAVSPFESSLATQQGGMLEVLISPALASKGKEAACISLVVRNITDEKEKECELARLSGIYEALTEINRAIHSVRTIEELLRKVCTALVATSGLTRASAVWREGGEAEQMTVAQRPQNTSLLAAAPAAECEDTARRTMQSGEASVSEDSTCASFPLRLHGIVAGALTVHADDLRYFQKRELALLSQAASDTSSGLDLLEHVLSRERAEEELRREAQFSSTMIESMPGILYFYDFSGRFLRWNRNFEIMSGYSGKEVATMHPLDFFPAEYKSELQTRISDVFERGASSAEAPFLAKDGTLSPFFFTGRKVEFGDQVCLVGVGIDISERKRAEALLGESEQKLRALFDQAPLGIAILDTESGRFLKVNAKYCAITGYAEEEMLNLTFQEMTHPEDLEEDLRNTHHLHSNEAICFHMEKRYIRKGGDPVWVHLTCVPLGGLSATERQHLAIVEEITERKLASALLEENERKYRELVELANSIILRWDSNGYITFLNEYGQQFFQYTEREIIGKHVVGTIVPWTEGSGRDLQNLMRQICADPDSFQANVNENIRRDGQRMLISWTNRILKDDSGDVAEILSVGTDITARHQAEEARRTSEARYRTLFECAPDGIVISNSEGYYLDANASMCTMLGYTAEEFTRLHSRDIISHSDEHRIDAALDEIGDRKDHQTEWSFRRKDGSQFSAEVMATLMPDGNILAMIRDITERKEAERALHELNDTLEQRVLQRTQELQEAVSRAESADRLKSAFLATMSHELRTPLNSIIGFTSIILQGLAGPLNAEQGKQLDMVRGSARHLLSLINDVLDLSKIEAGQFKIAVAPFDLALSLRKVMASVAPLAEKKGLSLDANISPALGEAVGDERRVEQVLLNLLSNSIKFTERGGVILDVQPCVDAESEGASVRIRVLDTGIGIREEHLSELFLPFRQLDSGLARNYEGTGLGLAICRRLVHLMGGEIHAQSTWGQGSEFTVVIPLCLGRQE